jgi:hypothetical protein
MGIGVMIKAQSAHQPAPMLFWVAFLDQLAISKLVCISFTQE